MEEVEKLLEVNRQAFLNQATYEAAIMTCVKGLPYSIPVLKKLCELNSKRFLPYWGIVMDKATNDNTSAYFTLFQSMVYGIRPFLDNRSSYKPPTSLAFETLSQSIQRHLQRMIEWTLSAFKNDIQALRLARLIMKHTEEHLLSNDALCKELILLLRQKQSHPEWEEEICKFICLLNTNGLDEADMSFLENLCNEYVMKVLVRKSPWRYKSSASAFNDEIILEYILGSLENDSSVNIVPSLFKRALGRDVRRLIPMMDRMSYDCLFLLMDSDNACLADLCKHAPAIVHSQLIERCLATNDLEALANLLNLETFDPSLIHLKEIEIVLKNQTDFVALRCWNGLARKGFMLPSSVIDNISACFNGMTDGKSVIVACRIFKQVCKIPAIDCVKNKLDEFESNIRVCKHLQTLLE